MVNLTESTFRIGVDDRPYGDALRGINRMSKFTLEQIGQLAGVSSATVSRVINNTANVTPEVRQRVLEVIAETGYRPNPAARTLAGHKSQIIGLVIPETANILFTDPYFPRLIQGIAHACRTHDYTLSLFLFDTLEDEARLSLRILRNQLFDGVIMTATQIADPLVDLLVNSEIPFVLIGQNDHPEVSFVDADNEAGAYTAVSHLLRLGYQRIATIAGPMNNLAAVQRRQGYRNALRERGVIPDDNLIVDADFTESGGYDAMTRLLAHRPDAVFVGSDTMALGALRALQEANVAVPDEIAVVGYDDLPPAKLTTPSLTTVRQPIKRAGILAVETLIDILEHGLKPPRRFVLPTELVIRASCGASEMARSGGAY